MNEEVSADGWAAPFPGGIVPVRKPRGSVSVKHLLTRNVGNLPVRAPAVDWAKIVTGHKRMFRTYSYGSDPLCHVIPPQTDCPRPCLLYTRRGTKKWEACPAVLHAFRREPLGAISSSDLEREGFRFLPAFRHYWTTRYKKLGWRPWDEITVVEVSPLSDWDWAAEWVLDHLYGDVTDE